MFIPSLGLHPVLFEDVHCFAGHALLLRSQLLSAPGSFSGNTGSGWCRGVTLVLVVASLQVDVHAINEAVEDSVLEGLALLPAGHPTGMHPICCRVLGSGALSPISRELPPCLASVSLCGGHPTRAQPAPSFDSDIVCPRQPRRSPTEPLRKRDRAPPSSNSCPLLGSQPATPWIRAARRWEAPAPARPRHRHPKAAVSASVCLSP